MKPTPPHKQEQQYGDAGIYEDRSPSPTDLSPPPTATPRPHQPHQKTFCSQISVKRSRQVKKTATGANASIHGEVTNVERCADPFTLQSQRQWPRGGLQVSLLRGEGETPS